jgi:hypothetical protein
LIPVTAATPAMTTAIPSKTSQFMIPQSTRRAVRRNPWKTTGSPAG